jgi:hypothetical protein
MDIASIKKYIENIRAGKYIPKVIPLDINLALVDGEVVRLDEPDLTTGTINEDHWLYQLIAAGWINL